MNLPIWLIVPFDPMRHHRHYHQLKESIREHGVRMPVIVRQLDNGLFQMISGEWRVLAARAAGLHEVPATVYEMTDREAQASLEYVLQKFSSPTPLTDEDMGKVCKHLRDVNKKTVAEIAKITRLGEYTVRRYLK